MFRPAFAHVCDLHLDLPARLDSLPHLSLIFNERGSQDLVALDDRVEDNLPVLPVERTANPNRARNVQAVVCLELMSEPQGLLAVRRRYARGRHRPGADVAD